MESVKISPKKCKIAMVLVGHHTGLFAVIVLSILTGMSQMMAMLSCLWITFWLVLVPLVCNLDIKPLTDTLEEILFIMLGCTLFWILPHIQIQYGPLFLHVVNTFCICSLLAGHILLSGSFWGLLFIAWSWAATSSPSVSPFRLLDKHLLVVTMLLLLVVVLLIIIIVRSSPVLLLGILSHVSTAIPQIRDNTFSLPGKLPLGASNNKFLEVPKESLHLSL